MASFVEIGSNALRLLGDDPITSLTEDSERARLVNAIYEEVRNEVTRAAMWNCAKDRQVLACLRPRQHLGGRITINFLQLVCVSLMFCQVIFVLTMKLRAGR